MKLYESVDKKYLEAIKQYRVNFDEWNKVIIKECEEELVSLKNVSDKIILSPQYYFNHIEGAENDCRVRKTIKDKLIIIANKLPDGFKLLVWDTFRTIETQNALFDRYYNNFKQTTNLEGEALFRYTKNFVSVASTDKLKPSPHNTGAAVDITICDKYGKPVNLGAGFDDFSPISYTRYYEEKLEKGTNLNEEENEILLNRRVLCNMFTEEGFANYPYEIWHKSFGDQMASKLLDLEYAIYGGIEAK